MKKRRQPCIVFLWGVSRGILCGILCGMLLLTSCTGKEKEGESETKEASKDGDMEQETKLINLQDFTKLEVVTDCTRFIPAAEDQSYNPETDINPNNDFKERRSSLKSADSGNIFYISVNETNMSTNEKKSLFAFQKETASAGIACDRPDCEHDMSVKGDCQANLYVMDAEISGMQYYNSDFYYTLSDGGATILYKTSSDHEIKSQYVVLLGEKGYGVCESWLIHREYIYFFVENDGFYRMSIDNPSNKEMIINMSEDTMSSRELWAEGSYIYFRIQGNHAFAVARYNMETNQIEQFIDINKASDDFMVYDKKIYYMGFLEENDECVVYQYDPMTGKNEIFLRGEDRKNFDTRFWLLHRDSDYLYIRREVIKKGDYYDGYESRDISYLAYTWDGAVAGEIMNTENPNSTKVMEPFKTFHNESTELIGSDNDRIYYVSTQNDTQVQENGIEELIEGTEKTVISYINKSEISAETAAPIHIAGEIYDCFDQRITKNEIYSRNQA